MRSVTNPSEILITQKEEQLSGSLFGMIKFGSRTELVLPDEPGLEIVAKLGDAVRGGSTIIARYAESTSGD